MINVHRPKGLKSSAKLPVVSFKKFALDIHDNTSSAAVLDVRILGYAYALNSLLIG